MSNTQYFFGIGAQKAGTTWLNDLLETYPSCALPTPKELHFFDVRHLRGTLGTEVIYLERLKALEKMAAGFARDVRGYRSGDRDRQPGIFQDGYLAKFNVVDRLRHVENYARYLRIRDLKDYIAYLTDLGKAQQARAVGEFTPSYSTLPAAAFREMDASFPGCRFIFIMRDPVERFLSQLRFKKKLQDKRGAEDFDPVEHLDASLDDPDFLLRSDYRQTIETLESVIPADRILYLFFEEMVSPHTLVDNLRQVEALLGLPPRPAEELLAFSEKKKNASPSAEFPETQMQRVRATMAPHYAFVQERFGRVPGGWARM